MSEPHANDVDEAVALIRKAIFTDAVSNSPDSMVSRFSVRAHLGDRRAA